MLSKSTWYSDENGHNYFQWQKTIGILGGRYNLPKFSKYLRKDKDICDFGCGGGFLLSKIENVRTKCGIEINPAAASDARAKGLMIYSKIEDVQENSLDVIISNHALEHVPDPLSALSALKEKLRTAGLMVFCLPIDEWRVQINYDPRDINHHLYTWTPQLIGNLFTESGMTVRHVSIIRNAWSPTIHRLFGWSGTIFRLACYFNAIIKKRYQLLIVAEKTRA